MKPFYRFIHDTHANFWVNVLGVTMIIVLDIVWVVMAYVLNVSLDAFAGFISGIPEGMLASDSLRNQMGIIIVVVNILILAWMGVSAFRKQTQEYPM